MSKRNSTDSNKQDKMVFAQNNEISKSLGPFFEQQEKLRDALNKLLRDALNKSLEPFFEQQEKLRIERFNENSI